MHVRATSVLPLKPQPVVSGSEDSCVEGLDELHDPVVEKPVREGRVVMTALARAVSESGLSEQMSPASSGHWRSAALWVKMMVGKPSVSTMESRRFR